MLGEDPAGGQTWHSYRCPVCGHADEVALAGTMASTVPCTHCATPLELSVRSPDEAAAAVIVARRWRRAR